MALWALGYVVYLLPSVFDDWSVPLFAYGMFGLMAASGLLLSPPIYAVVRLTGQMRFGRRLALIAFVVIAIALAHSAVEAVIYDAWIRVHKPEKELAANFQLAVSYNFLVVFWIHGLSAAGYGLLQSFYAIRDHERRLAESQRTAHQAQLAALRYQMNPHFLFNTLNAISTLVMTNRNEEAEAMLQKLSDFLRVSLTSDPDEAGPLAEELALVQDYLDIETVRFGERLNVTIDYPEELAKAGTPSFLLQPLVENAIKYAVAPSREPVTVRLSAASDGRDLLIAVEDDGAHSAAPAVGAGVSLENVRRRLAALYGERARLEAFALPGRGWRSVLRLPLEIAA